MKVLISAFGIGLGHAGRCLAISELLRKKGIDIVYTTFGPAYNYIKAHGYEVFKLPEIDFKTKRNGEFDFKKTILYSPKYLYDLSVQIYYYKKLIKKIKPDVILSDSDFSVLLLGKLLKIKKYLLIHQLRISPPQKIYFKNQSLTIDLQYILKHTCDCILLPDLEPPNTLYQKNLPISKGIKNKVIFTGFIVRKKPEELLPKKKIKKKYCKDKPLVYVSISGPGESRKLLLEYYRRILPVIKDKFFVLSEGEPKIKFKERKKILRASWLSEKERAELMKACDLIVSRSGFSSVCEILRYGKKSILTPIPNQTEQEFISKNLDSRNLAKEMLQKDIAYFPAVLEEALNDKSLSKNLKKYQRIAKKKDGAKEIVNIILNGPGEI